MSRTCLETTPGRLRLEAFLSRHATDGRTLEIGAEDSTCKSWFPQRVAINLALNAHIDIQADAYHLPFRDEAFDVVLCTEVLEHMHTPALALLELRRVLRPGGKLLLTTPFAFPIHYAPTDYYRFTRFGLTHLLDDWEIESLRETTSDGAALATYFHHWLLKKKGLQWKPPKLVWWCLWQVLTRSYRNGRREARPNKDSHMPAGYLVVAYKPARDAGRRMEI
ncbi:MAG TPA: methyltransferase domain-containing protein [Pyrinomonadaceae bacterium]|nr:methyltransferase domain-containing protein [Pyrinomonadaceae bacterium]